MITLTHSPFLKALGWSLLNSLWQFGILWLIFRTFLHSSKNISPALKHGLALLLMSAGFLWFAAELSFEYFAYSDFVNNSQSLPDFRAYSFYPAAYKSAKTFLENNLSYLSIFYLLMVLSFFIRFIRFFFYSHTIQTKGLSKLRPELRLYVQKLVQQLDISRNIQVWISEYVDSPMVIGFIKPVVLIPVACINQLSTKQLEAILLHELAHIRRNDYLVNLYIETIDILFFFNPFAKLLVKSIQQEREKSCDDWVLQFRFDPHQYASALLSLEQSRSSTYSLAIGAIGKNKNLLLQRIQRIMGVKKTNQESGFRMAGYFLTIGLLSFIALINPGNIVIENFDKTYAEVKILAPRFVSAFENRPDGPAASVTPSHPDQNRPRKTKFKPVPSDVNTAKNGTDNGVALTNVSFNLNDNGETPQLFNLLQSSATENKDFSIKDKDPELPEEAVEIIYPFVPNSSYSYYITEDSNILKLKAQKDKLQSVSQSRIQVQKAMEKLDWQKIAKNQQLSKVAILKLQKAIKQSFSSLNWSEIYTESVDSALKEDVQNMRLSLKQEVDNLNKYKIMQRQYESIKTGLKQEQEKYKQGAEIELQEIQKEVKKKKVIVYL